MYCWIWSSFTSVIFFPFLFPLEAPTLMGTERFQDSEWRRRIVLPAINSFPLSLNTVSVALGLYVRLKSSDRLQSTKIESSPKQIKAINALLSDDVSFRKGIPSECGGRSWHCIPAANSHKFMKPEPGGRIYLPLAAQHQLRPELTSTFDPQRSAEHSAPLTASESQLAKWNENPAWSISLIIHLLCIVFTKPACKMNPHSKTAT